MAAFLTQRTFFQRHKLEPYPRIDFTFQLLHFRTTRNSYNRRNLRNELLDAGRTVPFYRGKTKQSLDMSDIAQFAEWAFGPDGLPNLKVIAFGDFTMDSRSYWTQLLLCRRDPEDAEDFSSSTERNGSRKVKETRGTINKRRVDGNSSEDESSEDGSSEDEIFEDEKRRNTKNRKVDQKSAEDDTR